MSKIQITNGAFQDAEGNVLVSGYLTLQLSHDEEDPSTPAQICGGLAVTVPLDTSGNISGTVHIWTNDTILPAGSFYIVNAFRANGTPAWVAPQAWTLLSSFANPYNVGNIIPVSPPNSGAVIAGSLLRADGTQVGLAMDLHITGGTTTLVAGAATVTMTGSSTFSGATNYNVLTTAAHAVAVTRISGSQFSLAGTGTDVVTWFAIGQPTGS